MPGKRRSANEWYSPYFAPTTVVIAAIVLIVSVQAGKYVGYQFIQRDKSLYFPAATLTISVPVAHRVPAKAAVRRSSSKASAAPSRTTAP